MTETAERLLDLCYEERLESNALLVLADALGEDNPVVGDLVRSGARLRLPWSHELVAEMCRIGKERGAYKVAEFREEWVKEQRETVKRCWRELEYGDCLIPKCHVAVEHEEQIHICGGGLHDYAGLGRVEYWPKIGFKTWPENQEVPYQVRLLALCVWLAWKASPQNLYDGWSRTGEERRRASP